MVVTSILQLFMLIIISKNVGNERRKQIFGKNRLGHWQNSVSISTLNLEQNRKSFWYFYRKILYFQVAQNFVKSGDIRSRMPRNMFFRFLKQHMQFSHWLIKQPFLL